MELSIVRVPNKVTVEVDSREHYPLLFPANIRYFYEDGRAKLIKIVTVRKQLKIGDYRMKEFPEGCLVERKGAARELGTNLFSRDKRRCISAIRRLAGACRRPVLLCDFSMSDLYRDDKGLLAGMVVSGLTRLVAEYRLTLLMLGRCKRSTARTNLGATVVHLMLAEGLRHETS